VLRLHQIRYHVDLLPYDLTWNILAAVIIVAGVLLLITAYRRPVAADGAASRPRA
jgi:uncharacterized membrane protein